jgi:ribose 1,5-bisphosphokinase PhnN
MQKYLFITKNITVHSKKIVVIIALIGVATYLTITQAHKFYASAEQSECENTASCQQLSYAIQQQIDQLVAKGLGNLSNAERHTFSHLQKQLIAIENAKQAKIKQEQQQKIDELRGMILDK